MLECCLSMRPVYVARHCHEIPPTQTYAPSVRDVGKAREVLARIGIGLATNPTVTESEMLLYVHATVAPFLLPQVC